MIAAAVVVGAVAWSGDALALPLVCVFPALWAFAPSRLVSAFVCAAYFLAASRGLPQGVVNFYGSDFGVGIALWIGAAAVFVFVHATLWQKQPGWNRAFWFALAAILMSVPPFGIVGWAQPITAAGIEYSRIRLPVVQIRLKHVQLIQIGQQRGCRRIHVASPM